CREQSVLIFAVAVLVVENVRGGLRLISRQAQRQADVAKILRHEVVKRLGLFQIGSQSFGEGRGFLLHFLRRNSPIFFQTGVPASNLLPTGEGRQLDVRNFVRFFLLLFLFPLVCIFIFRVFLKHQVRTRPVVDAPA